jgi:hypothetical protein
MGDTSEPIGLGAETSLPPKIGSSTTCVELWRMSSGPQSACKLCDRQRADGHKISYRGLCSFCAEERMKQNNRQISAHRGPFFDHQRYNTLLAWGGVPAEIVSQRAR